MDDKEFYKTDKITLTRKEIALLYYRHIYNLSWCRIADKLKMSMPDMMNMYKSIGNRLTVKE